MSKKSMDKRLAFVAMCINNGFGANLANSWYVANKQSKISDLSVVFANFKVWMSDTTEVGAN